MKITAEKGKPIQKTHYEDEVRSAYEEIEVGGHFVYKSGEKIEILFEKRISFHKCPICKSTDTFHKAMGKIRKIDGNVFKELSLERDNELLSKKYDLCFKCGHEWAMEVWVIKLLYSFENLEGISKHPFKNLWKSVKRLISKV